VHFKEEKNRKNLIAHLLLSSFPNALVSAFKRVLYAHLDCACLHPQCASLSEKQTNFLIFSGEIKLLLMTLRICGKEDENQPNCMQENNIENFFLMLLIS
jgi:hypothetical protein